MNLLASNWQLTMGNGQYFCPRTGGVLVTEQVEQNKQMVLAFYDLMFNQCQPAAAVEQYAEGNFVVLHCHQEWPGQCAWAGSASRLSLKPGSPLFCSQRLGVPTQAVVAARALAGT